ncbi:MAG TPA: tetratricopeptide repeat protein [Cyclobacteriaceae bacterium]|nr:tetratricopeptide repeat protein [Cyclobacteriaceae bacterium]
MIIRNKIIVSLFFMISLILYSGHAFPQKKKDIKQNDTESVKISADESDPRVAENYFIEAEKYFILEDYAKSLQLFLKTLELQPKNAPVNYKIGQIYTLTDDFDKALPYAQQASMIDPRNKFYYLLLAEIYTRKSDFKHAAETYEKIIGTIPGCEENLFELAAIYLFQKEYDKAINCYDRIEDKFGINEQVSLQKKEIYKRQGKLDKVIAEGQKLIDAFPDEPEYVILQANTLIANDLLKEAMILLEKWLPLYPNNGNMLLTLAEAVRSTDPEKSKEYVNQAFGYPDLNLQIKLQYIIGLLEKPLDSLNRKFLLDLADKTIATYPDQAESYAIYGDVLIRFDSVEAAKKMYLNSLNLNDNNFQAWQNVINIELNSEDWDNVVVHGEKAIEIFPNQSILYFFLGTAYLMKKDYQKCVTNLEIGKKLSSDNLQLTSLFNAQLGDAYNYLKDFVKSDNAYNAVLQFDPQNDHVLNNYSYFLSLRKDKLDEAVKMSTKLIQANPDNATYLDTHAWVLYQLGKTEEARKFIEKALQQKENVSGAIVEHYGDILFRLGNEKEAVEQWKKAREMGETSDLILKKISDGKLYE